MDEFQTLFGEGGIAAEDGNMDVDAIVNSNVDVEALLGIEPLASSSVSGGNDTAGTCATAGALAQSSTSDGTLALPHRLELLPLDPAMQLPAPTHPKIVMISCMFHLKTEVDLKKLAFAVRYAEYNPRKHTSVQVRVHDSKLVAMVRASGSCTITGQTDEDTMLRSAKKVAKMVKLAGHEGVRFRDFAVTSLMCKARLPFPVRLERLAIAWRQNVVYEPETYSGCVIKMQNPKRAMLVTSGGSLMVSGLRKVCEVEDTLKRLMPAFLALPDS